MSVIFQGSEFQNSDLKRAITAFNRGLRQICGPVDVDGAPWVSAIVLVEGSWGEAGFEGVRVVEQDGQERNVAVQIAVSRAVQEGDVGAFLMRSLREACALAAVRLRERGETFDLPAAERLLDEAAQTLLPD